MGIKNGGSHKSYLSTANNLALLRPKTLNNWNFYKIEPQQMSELHRGWFATIFCVIVC